MFRDSGKASASDRAKEPLLELPFDLNSANIEKKTGVTGMADEAAQLWLTTEIETIETTEVVRGERGSGDIGGGYGQPRVTDQVKTVVRQRVPLDAVALKTQMNGLLQVVGEVFDQANQTSDLILDEVELSVEINAQGQVSILGNGGSLSDKGSIKLKFKRSTPTD